MSIILAHRGNTNGPHPGTENSAAAIRHALSQGFGIEIDIRRADNGRFYISHDPRPTADSTSADDVMRLLRAHPGAMAAINVKELGYEADLLRFLDAHGVLGQAFLFDMELIEPHAGETARQMRALHPRVRLAARVSDRGESIERALAIPSASVIWLDEFDGAWATEADVRRLKQSGRLVIAVSPELHGAGPEATGDRWADFMAWGVDGLCTDFASAFSQASARLEQPVSIRVAA